MYISLNALPNDTGVSSYDDVIMIQECRLEIDTDTCLNSNTCIVIDTCFMSTTCVVIYTYIMSTTCIVIHGVALDLVRAYNCFIDTALYKYCISLYKVYLYYSACSDTIMKRDIEDMLMLAINPLETKSICS